MFDFPLTVESIDDVPEKFRTLYSETDDGIKLDADLANKVTDTGNLSSTLQKERKRAAQLEKENKAWKGLGESPQTVSEILTGFRSVAETPDELQELISQKDELLKGKGDQSKVIDQIQTAHKTELEKITASHKSSLEEKDSEIGRLRTAMETEMIDSALTAEIAKQKGIPDLLLPIARRSVKVVKEGDGYIRKVVDMDGDPRVNAKGDPMSLSELVTEYRASDVFARAFDGDGRGGSGAPAGNGGGGNNRATKTYKLAEWQRVVGEAKGPERQKLLADKAAGRINVVR